jgi:peptidoglycan/xylan/chitin deacetylase (PgdA/CDA1 family)
MKAKLSTAILLLFGGMAATAWARPYFVGFEQMAAWAEQQKCDRLSEIALDTKAACRGQKLSIRNQNFQSPHRHKEIAFTFDLGAGLGELPFILNTLAKHHSKATFFITGKFMNKYPKWTWRLVRRGHEVANHTYHHVYFRSRRHMTREVTKTEKLFYRITGKKLAPYLRTPYFQEDSRSKKWILRQTRRLGYRHFNTTVDTMDWTTSRSRCYVPYRSFARAFVRLRIRSGVRRTQARLCPRGVRYLLRRSPKHLDLRGAIVLMHSDTKRRTTPLTKGLDRLFSRLKAKGYAMVTLTEVMNDRHAGKPPVAR